jgi:hypothetical protein
MDAVSGSQEGGRQASHSSMVRRGELGHDKVDSDNQIKMNETVGKADSRLPPNNNGPGIGGHLDVYG